MSDSPHPRRTRPRTDSDIDHIYRYFYGGPHEFDAYPPAHWPPGVIEDIPEDESDAEQQSRERRERYRACIVMGGQRLQTVDLDNDRIDRHIAECIERGELHPYQWARHRPTSS